MAHTYTNLLIHVLFSTKDRQHWLDADLKSRLFPYMAGIIKKLQGQALSINGPADHVHLLLLIPPTLAVSDLMEKLKANSSKWIHETFPKRAQFAWQTGYTAFSVSESNRAMVGRYIAEQEAHHRKLTYQEEVVALLKKHGVEYDARYVVE